MHTTCVKRVDIIVSGLVQGVGFRYTIRRVARQYRLKGEVRNMKDETVHIICEGKDDHVKEFVKEIRNAEKPVEIDDIKIEYSEPSGKYKNFKIVPGDISEEMVEGYATGAMYLHNMNKKQDQMLDKQDQMINKQDQMINKQDQMLNKQDTTIDEIRALSSSIRETMDSRFMRLEAEISKIKTRLSI